MVHDNLFGCQTGNRSYQKGVRGHGWESDEANSISTVGSQRICALGRLGFKRAMPLEIT
jgi:hypothetical protein